MQLSQAFAGSLLLASAFTMMGCATPAEATEDEPAGAVASPYISPPNYLMRTVVMRNVWALTSSAPPCVDVPSGSSAPLTYLQTYGCHGGNNQLFDVTPASATSAAYEIHPYGYSWLCLGVDPARFTRDGAWIQQQICNGSDLQRFYIDQIWTRTAALDVTITNVASKKCLSTPGRGILEQQRCDGREGEPASLGGRPRSWTRPKCEGWTRRLKHLADLDTMPIGALTSPVYRAAIIRVRDQTRSWTQRHGAERCGWRSCSELATRTRRNVGSMAKSRSIVASGQHSFACENSGKTHRAAGCDARGAVVSE